MNKESITRLISFDDMDTSTGHVSVSGTQTGGIIDGSVFWWYVCNCKDPKGGKNPFAVPDNTVNDPAYYGEVLELCNVPEEDILYETDTNAGPYTVKGDINIDGHRVTLSDALNHRYRDDDIELLGMRVPTDYVDESDYVGIIRDLLFEIKLPVENTYKVFKKKCDEYFIRHRNLIINEYKYRYHDHDRDSLVDDWYDEIKYHGRDQGYLDSYFDENDPNYDPYEDEDVIEEQANNFADEDMTEKEDYVIDEFIDDMKYWCDLIINTYPVWCQGIV